jgi:hypothetical protein
MSALSSLQEAIELERQRVVDAANELSRHATLENYRGLRQAVESLNKSVVERSTVIQPLGCLLSPIYDELCEKMQRTTDPMVVRLLLREALKKAFDQGVLTS